MNNPLINLLQFITGSLKDWFSISEQAVLSLKLLCLEQSNAVIGTQLSNLMFGLIFGAQNSLNSSLQHSFKIMGMLHIWSASGFNVGLFLTAVACVLQIIPYFSHKTKTILLLLSALFFWWMSGQGPSMQRAIIMTGLSLLVRSLWLRQMSSLRLLFYTVMIILLLDATLTQSLSLQFSTAATAGIILLSPFLQKVMDLGGFSSSNNSLLSGAKVQISTKPNLVKKVFSKIFRHFTQNLALFFSVQIALLPLISSTWGEIGLLSVVTNALLSGFLPILVTLGLVWFGWTVFLTSLNSMITFHNSQVLARFLASIANFSQVLGHLITLPLIFFLSLARFFTEVDLGVATVPEFGLTQTVLWYLGWGIAGWLYQRKTLQRKVKPLAIKVFADV